MSAAIDTINAGVNNRRASFTLVLGDLVLNTQHNSVNWIDSAEVLLGNLDSTYYIVPGNHENETGELREADALAEFGNQIDAYPPTGTTGWNNYYYFTKEDWAFLGYNSVDSASTGKSNGKATNFDTLTSYLNAVADYNTVFFSHHGTIIPEGSGLDYQQLVESYQDVQDTLINRKNVKLVLSGHFHDQAQEAKRGDTDFWVLDRPHNNKCYWVDFYSNGKYKIYPITITY